MVGTIGTFCPDHPVAKPPQHEHSAAPEDVDADTRLLDELQGQKLMDLAARSEGGEAVQLQGCDKEAEANWHRWTIER